MDAGNRKVTRSATLKKNGSNVAEIHVDHPGVHCKSSGPSCSTITYELTGIKHPKTSPQMMPGASKYPATNGSSHDPPKNGHVFHPQNGFSHRVNSSPTKILEFDSTLAKPNSISPLSSNHCIPSEESRSAGIVPDFPIFRNGQNIQTSPGDTRSKSTTSHVDHSGSFLDQIKDRACNSSNHSADSSAQRPSIGSSQENGSAFKLARELSESQSDDSHIRSRFFKNNGAHGGQQQNTSSSSTTKDKVICQWQQCSHNISVDALSEHINSAHIHSQIRPGADEESFVCMWDGCKVYNKPSTSRTWLEKHVICHLGVKPFRCIVAQCRMRFASQYMLTRHVNGHFNGSLRSQPPRKGDCLSRQLKKRRLRNVKPAPVITKDYFDSLVMDSIQNALARCSQQTQVDMLHSGNSIAFHSSVMAKRTGPEGHAEVLLRWSPRDVLLDEWVPESRAASSSTRVIPLSRLPNDIFSLLYGHSLSSSSYHYRKHRRK